VGALVGLGAGIGLLLIIMSWSDPTHRRVASDATQDGQAAAVSPGRRSRPRLVERVADLLAAAGITGVRPGGLMAVSVGAGVVGGVVVLGASRSVAVGSAFAVLSAYGPWALVRHRAQQRRIERRELWPEVVDNLVSAVRAGLSLPEALTQLGARGPTAMREPFQRFGEDYRATGRFDLCLDLLKDRLADPVGDRVVESVRLAREVGGADLGRLLRTLSTFLREEARTRAELETRQGWTVNAARLAVAAPWVVLLLLAAQPGAVAAYDSPTGVAVLAGGGAACLLAYRLMLRLGRLPTQERVLR
jgi:tight adherence protein B